MPHSFDYFTASNADQFAFFQIPKELFTKDIFSGLSTDSKVLYGILLDRVSLSRYNNWLDKEGHVYIIFKQAEIMSTLNCSKPKATKLVNELMEIGLIEKVRQGQNMPDKIYVKNFNSITTPDANRRSKNLTTEGKKSELPEVKKFNSRESKNLTSGGQKFEPLSNTEYNKPNFSEPKIDKTIIKDEEEARAFDVSAMSPRTRETLASWERYKARNISEVTHNMPNNDEIYPQLSAEVREFILSYAQTKKLQDAIADFIIMRKKEAAPLVWIKTELSELQSCDHEEGKTEIIRQAIINDWKHLPSPDAIREWQSDWPYLPKWQR